jgi:predicted DNA-binding transcriptional regulator YafY
MTTKQLKKIQYLHSLIARQATGSPKCLAAKLSVSERTIYNYVAFLKSEGAPIHYCYLAQSYVYTTYRELKIEAII